jgi:DNA-binding protein HU-beta
VNKSELIDAIAKEAEMTKAAAARALDAVITSVTKACLLYTSDAADDM